MADAEKIVLDMLSVVGAARLRPDRGGARRKDRVVSRLLRFGELRRAERDEALALRPMIAGGGSRTLNGVAPEGILSPLRLPFRHPGPASRTA